jgi:type II secretory ATPase GspE/PulE/Tfp pilus assembly ATPase PilB-like protein
MTAPVELEELARKLLEDAVAEDATDVHLTPSHQGLRLRYRIDGHLRVVREFPATLRDTLPHTVARLANLGSDAPADGRFQLDAAASRFRVSVLPTPYGPNVVLRRLDLRPELRRLDALDMPSDVLADWQACLDMPGGLLIVTGPTGCGKTTTLYASLLRLVAPERNVLTVEQPVEADIDWAVQTAVPRDAGFGDYLRTVLAQDPDIVFCSEVRDAEVGTLLAQMAITGHLVLTALHANDEAEALTRLTAAGVAASLVGSAVQGILSQRLVARPCPGCRTERSLTAQEAAWLDEAGLPKPKRTVSAPGCPSCGGSGAQGRAAVFHLLRPSEGERAMLAEVAGGDATLEDLRAVCAARVGTLRRAAMQRALEGGTTLQEAHRVTRVAPMGA